MNKMNKDKTSSGHEHLESNVEKLLGGLEPRLTLAEENKAKILAALQADPARRRSVRAYWLTAAAAVLIVAVAILRPWGVSDGLAWADVAGHLVEATTLDGWVVAESRVPGGPTTYNVTRLRQKDPNRNRGDHFGVSDSAPRPPFPDSFPSERAEWSRITVSGRDRSSSTHISWPQRSVRRTTYTYSGTELAARDELPREMVTEAWQRLRNLAHDRTRVIGEREIDGIPAVGFETELSAVFGSVAQPMPEGVIRVWAARGSGAPLEIEVEAQGPGGVATRFRMTGLVWNAPLQDELFEFVPPHGWRLEAQRVLFAGFEKTSLTPGITLLARSGDGTTLLTESDVVQVASGTEIHQEIDADPVRTIFLTLTPQAGERLEAFTSRNLDQPVELDFNGEIRYSIRIGGVIREQMQLDITALGKTLEEFEAEYLAD